ncbi:hypothetical protein LPU83_pLPU83c_0458 (plasmid) [Rhizobium favelukesii]|uniref:Uncharacterized protein n=1 Tax=Rhizobium favelukesii TaxID=348824 RepID=W6RLA7_9HYPH|nr:hypothetical protein LPU83_pLPU83c_0458 [Rhizobium favelukesii]
MRLKQLPVLKAAYRCPKTDGDCAKTLNGATRQQVLSKKISGFDEAPCFWRIRQWAALIKNVAQWIREELSGFVSIWRILSAF